MRRLWIVALIAALALTGCAPSTEDQHPDWDESWGRIAEYVGVEPLEGFTLNESSDALFMSGLYYATWTSGKGRDFINSDGEEATVYDAQIYVLLEECRDPEAAKETVGSWIAREKQSYTVGETYTKTLGTQNFEILPLITGSEGNPYTHGTAALAVRNEWAISVELVCSDLFDGDSQTILERFLTGFHYSEE